MDVEKCSSSCTWMDEALDHLEKKTYEIYDQSILDLEMEVGSESLYCKKVKKMCEMIQYL